MKDSELRGLILQSFYELRGEHAIGINIDGLICVRIPHNVMVTEALRICAQLQDYDLIEWHEHRDERNAPCAGSGRITALGSDVIEGESQPPIPLRIDASQHITISGTNVSGLQIAGAHSHQQQNVTQQIEQIIKAVEDCPATPEQKQEGKSRLRRFLESEVAANLFGAGVKALIDRATQ